MPLAGIRTRLRLSAPRILCGVLYIHKHNYSERQTKWHTDGNSTRETQTQVRFSCSFQSFMLNQGWSVLRRDKPTGSWWACVRPASAQCLHAHSLCAAEHLLYTVHVAHTSPTNSPDSCLRSVFVCLLLVKLTDTGWMGFWMFCFHFSEVTPGRVGAQRQQFFLPLVRFCFAAKFYRRQKRNRVARAREWITNDALLVGGELCGTHCLKFQKASVQSFRPQLYPHGWVSCHVPALTAAM